MGLAEADLQPCSVPLIGFSGASVWPLGRITLPVTAGTRTFNMEFVVVKMSSPYNAIVGRNWLHKMEAVASTFHQVMHFVGRYGQVDVLGDQVAAKAATSRPSAVRSNRQRYRLSKSRKKRLENRQTKRPSRTSSRFLSLRGWIGFSYSAPV